MEKISAGASILDRFPERAIRFAPIIWIFISVLIAIEDHFTDPFIQFPILFLIPITLATIYNGLNWGIGLSLVLPLVRFVSEYDQNSAAKVQESVNTAIDIVVFVAITVLVNIIAKQRRMLVEEVSVLRGLLPICGHCKRIRDENDKWEQLEKYISEHSEARFSHGLCPQCVEQYYPGMGIKGLKK